MLVGNEKGGSGKTTTSVHLAIALCYAGLRVSCIDLDIRQQSFTRYIENRIRYLDEHNLSKPCPTMVSCDHIGTHSHFHDLTEELKTHSDVIIIDTPGAHNAIATAAHTVADKVITPVNDSFLDIDLIAQISDGDLSGASPGLYSQVIWQQKIERAKHYDSTLDWIVIRNRLSSLEARNKKNINKTLSYLAKKLGFRIGSGFSERVIFRELFPYGMTLLDVIDSSVDIKLTTSHIAARQELRGLISDLKLSALDNAKISI